MSKTVLVVAAHPDDEILGVGATIAKHVSAGDRAHAAVLSEGASARYEQDMVASLRAAAERSADTIGFASIEFLGLPDQRMDTLPLLDVTQSIETIVQRLKPEVIYTHSPGDVNADHGVVSRAAWTACRPFATPWVEMFACFETPSSTEWGWPLADGGFNPHHFVDVEKTLQVKLDAMSHYESELREYPHPRSIRGLKERAAYWGACSGRAAAEAFVVLRSVS